MRLIDADALLVKYDSEHEGPPGRARKLIEDAPTIDAIPIEWLLQVLEDAKKYPILGFETIVDIPYLINRFRKEMGGINEDKIGVWEPLGHRPRLLSHPGAEDFRCSLCGYEAYTIFAQPPNRCPICRAKMVVQEGKS